MASNQFRLFARMWMITADYRILPGFTEAGLVFKTVDAAFSRAERAGFEQVDLSFHRILNSKKAKTPLRVERCRLWMGLKIGREHMFEFVQVIFNDI